MKTGISVCTAIMPNTHGNPYVHSTIVLCDDNRQLIWLFQLSSETRQEAGVESSGVGEGEGDGGVVVGNGERCSAVERGSGDVEAGPSGNGEGETEGEKVEGEEEETDLKLAWELLELARVICQKYAIQYYIQFFVSPIINSSLLCPGKTVTSTS